MFKIERSEIVLLWCSDSFTKRVLVSFSCRNFSHTLNIDWIVTKPNKKLDKATQGLHGHEVSLRSDHNSRNYKHLNTEFPCDPGAHTLKVRLLKCNTSSCPAGLEHTTIRLGSGRFYRH